MGISALGNSSGFDVKVLRETPGPHRMRAWKPDEGTVTECGILVRLPGSCWIHGQAAA